MKRQVILVLVVLLAISVVSCTQAEPIPTPNVDATVRAAVQATLAPAGEAPQVAVEQPTSPPVEPTEQRAADPRPTSTKEQPAATGPQVTVSVDWEELVELFSNRGLVVQPVVEKLAVLSLDGSEVAMQSGADSFSFRLTLGAAYLVKARSSDGVNLWALTPVVTGDTVQNISLQTTYQAGLIYAAEGAAGISSGSVDALKESAGLALDSGADRLVNTVKRVVNNALLWGVDYSIVTEVNPVNLRAFGGGLAPVRSLAVVINEPEPDYVPHIYMLNTASLNIARGGFFLDRILMSEMKADRWTVIVAAEDIPPRVYRGLGGLHMVHGGTTLVYGEDKCFRWKGSKCQSFRQVLIAYPLDAPPGTPPVVITALEDFDGAHRPQWSWDEEEIAFHAFPDGRLSRAQIYVMDRDGGGVTQLTFKTKGQNGARVPSWAPDNTSIVYVSDQEAFSWDIWLMNSDGSGQRNITQGRVQFPNEPKFSPDGRRILFYASDVPPEVPIRGGPDKELWIMDRDGSNLRKITDNDVDDERAVWGLNGVDIIYSVDDKNWEAANVFTAEKLFEFPGITRGRYLSPVLAATEHVLIPSQAAIEAGQVDANGYVNDDWLTAQLEIKMETGTTTKPATSKSAKGYAVTTPSKDPLSGIRYEIFTAFTQTPIYQSDVGGWIPPIISWP